MPITLPTKVERLVQEQLARGRYSSTEEVLVAALERLRHEEDIFADLQAAIDDEAAGRLRDFEEVDAELRERYGLPKAP
jgi:putative addiction module CopG family antidote